MHDICRYAASPYAARGVMPCSGPGSRDPISRFSSTKLADCSMLRRSRRKLSADPRAGPLARVAQLNGTSAPHKRLGGGDKRLRLSIPSWPKSVKSERSGHNELVDKFFIGFQVRREASTSVEMVFMVELFSEALSSRRIALHCTFVASHRIGGCKTSMTVCAIQPVQAHIRAKSEARGRDRPPC